VKRIFAILFSFGLALAFLDGTLALIDPLGIVRFRGDLRQFYAEASHLSDVTDYVLTPGIHDFGDWVMAVDTDGRRIVPDTAQDCVQTLAFVGDSVTMGFGVDDAETWVNLVAREFPGLCFINAGVSGYNSRSVRETLPAADIYIYYIVENDVETVTPPHPSSPLDSTLYRYLWYLYHKPHVGTKAELARFWADIEDLAARGIYFVGDSDLMARVAAQYPAQSFMVERWNTTVSWADGHADANGNQEIATQMIEIVKEVLNG
jgi:hypothetical protein